MEIIKRCKISIYDSSVTEPPYKFIQIDEVEVKEPENDHRGEEFADRLRTVCKNNGYHFRFYSLCSEDDNYDYDVVVFNYDITALTLKL